MLTSILLGAAGELAVPIIKKILGDKFGNNELVGGVIDVIAQKAGVSVDELPSVALPDLQTAIVAAEPEAADLLAQHVESQRLMNETLAAELDKDGPTWTWAWRPFGMWLFLAMTAHLVVLVPFLNILLTSPLIMVLDVPTFVTLFLTYTGLYMGGHTAKSAVAAWKAK